MSEGEQREQEQPSGERSPSVRPKVWIASLSDYTDGHLHGAWIEADQEPDDIWAEINEVLRTSPQPLAEEWAVFDYEGFGPLRLSEYESVERISQLGRGIAQHGEPFAAFANFLGSSDPDLLDSFEFSYLGRWESLAAYAQNYLESIWSLDFVNRHVQELLHPYILLDGEALARRLQADGYVLAVEDSECTGVYLYRPPG